MLPYAPPQSQPQGFHSPAPFEGMRIVHKIGARGGLFSLQEENQKSAGSSAKK